jgi:phage shock protein PspC (stress-responsive transcriptional regulator)
MKKTLTISISNIVFHIEEDAYDKLHRYLEAITAHFKGFEGKEEVIADIEARIAEILQKKISVSKEVVTIADIEDVVGIMGQPSDFGPEEEAKESTPPPSSYYMSKRLYRDPDHRVIAGICSGLGAYFNIDPIWVRLIFFISVGVSGFGVPAYIILWIVVPEARTTAERLQMRGEPVTVSNIERNFKDEMKDIKDKVKDFAHETSSNIKRETGDFRRRHGDDIRSGVNSVGRFFLRLLFIFIGFLVLIIGICFTVVYLSLLFKFPIITLFDNAGIHVFPLYSVIDRIFISNHDLRAFSTGLMILFGIPLVMMLWGGIRLIFNIPRERILSAIATFFWVCALVVTLIFGFKLANSFRYPGEFSKESSLIITKTDTLHVIADKHLPDDFRWERSGVLYFPELKMVVSNDKDVIRGIPLIKFRTSKDSTAKIIIFTSSRGAFKNDADENAEKISYTWQQKHDTLVLPDSFVLPDDEKWRRQEVRVEVELPEGTTVDIDKHLHPMLGYHKYINENERIGTMYYMNNEGLAGK